MRVLALQGSPRKNGNTATLLEALLQVLEHGNTVKRFHLAGLNIRPCLSCYACKAQQSCNSDDDMQVLYPHLAASELVILASPIYFYGVTAQMKAVIDRCQHLWLNPTKQSPNRRGVLVLTAGALDASGKGVEITREACRLFFRCLGAPLTHTLVATNTDTHPVHEQADVLHSAKLLGNLLLTQE